MSLFGTSPTDESPGLASPRSGRGGVTSGLFDSPSQKPSSSSLFADDGGDDSASPWDLPTPRKKQSRAEMIRNLLPAADVPDSYIEAFDAVLRQDGRGGRITAGGIHRLFTLAGLETDAQTRIVSLVAPASTTGGGDDLSLDRNEFNVLLALVALAQEGEVISLDGVDERRRSEFNPLLSQYLMPHKPSNCLPTRPWLGSTIHVSLSPPLQVAGPVWS